MLQDIALHAILLQDALQDGYVQMTGHLVYQVIAALKYKIVQVQRIQDYFTCACQHLQQLQTMPPNKLLQSLGLNIGTIVH